MGLIKECGELIMQYKEECGPRSTNGPAGKWRRNLRECGIKYQTACNWMDVARDYTEKWHHTQQRHLQRRR